MLAVTISGMDHDERHRVMVSHAWRPDGRGVQHRRYYARCLCGWTEIWVASNTEAERLGREHRAQAAAATSKAR